MTGCGSEAQMFDSKLVMEEIEDVFVAEAVGLAPMVTETEAAEVKDHVQVAEAGKLAAQPLGDNPDSVERQAVSDRIDGLKDQTESNNVVLVVEVPEDVELLEELLKSGDNNDGELMDIEVLENTSMAETVTELDDIKHDNELCGSPSAEVKVKPQDDADGVGNEQTATGGLGDTSMAETVTELDDIKHDNELCGSSSAEVKVKPQDDADGVGNEQTATGGLGDTSMAETVSELDEIKHDNELCGSPSAEIKVNPQDDSDGVGNEQTATGGLGDKKPNIFFDNFYTEEERAAFVKEVEAFYKGNNLEFRRPKFYKEDLNLLKLWKAVTNLGGYGKVTSCKLWKHVGELFNPPKTCTTVSWTFRHYYEKALLEYEQHKKPGTVLPHSVPSLVEPITVVSPLPDGTQAPGSGNSKRAAAACAPDNIEVCHPIIKDKSLSPAPKSDSQPKTSGSLKRKRPSATEHSVGVELQFGTMLFDIGAPADNVTVKVKKTDNSYEVYALIPGFLRDEVNVQSDPAGFVVISGEPKVLDDPWGVAPFKKVVRFPSRIDPSKTSAVVTERVQVYVCAPFEISDVSK